MRLTSALLCAASSCCATTSTAKIQRVPQDITGNITAIASAMAFVFPGAASEMSEKTSLK